MIDELHPMQIGLFPLDIKCHTPQQLQQQLQQHQQQHQPQQRQHHQHNPHHQQQQQQQQHSALIAGNERMLTTTPTTATASPSATVAHSPASSRCTPATTRGTPTPPLAAATAAVAASLALNETMNMARNGNPSATATTDSTTPTAPAAATTTATTTTTIRTRTATPTGTGTLTRTIMSPAVEAAATGDDGFGAGGPATMMASSPAANVNGNCNNHNSSSSTNSGSSNNMPKTSNASQQTQHQQQQAATHPCGPGPPSQHLQPSGNNSNNATSVSARVTLAECSLNGMNAGICNAAGSGCGGGDGTATDAGNIAALCANNNGLALQHQLQQHHHSHQQQHQQQHHQQQHHQHQQHHQQQQQQMQMHHHPSQLHHSHTHSQLHHPAAAIAGNASALGGGLHVDASMSMSMSLSLSLSCGGGGGGGGGSGSGGSNGGSAANGLMPLPLTQCGYCCQPICDRYIMRVADTSFHEGCLKCATCSLHLVQSCYARDGKLYCRIDYERLFIRNRCLGCGHKIACDELVMRTHENVFHLKCFACVVCGAVLKKGEQYVVKQGQLFCRFDYEKEVEMLQGYDFYGDDLFPPKLDGRRGPKRPRTILNTQQRRAFKASFEVSPKPCRKVRENLAKETGLSLRIVQVWFQNQRAKVKKIQKKAKQEHSTKGASDSQDSQESDSSSLAKIKDEAHSDSESLLESPFSACGGGGIASAAAAAAVGADGIVGGGGGGGSVAKLRCIKDENENAPFNCMETNKENCNKTNEPILNTILGLSYATFQQLMGPFAQTPMINPIDRLYSMQNSYFRPDELSYGDCGKDAADH